jgi:hypothetical protein
VERIVRKPTQHRKRNRISPTFTDVDGRFDGGELRIIGSVDELDSQDASHHEAQSLSRFSPQVVHRILMLPPDGADHEDVDESQFNRRFKHRDIDGLDDSSLASDSSDLMQSSRASEALDGEGYELSFSILGTFTSHLLNIAAVACTGVVPIDSCPSRYPHSVLRKQKRGLSPAARASLQHDDDTMDAIGRSVSFTSLEIREFNMTLGNHPSAVSGPPVMLDLKPASETKVIPLEEYERIRGPRRDRKQLKLSYRQRKSLLEQERGFSPSEIHEAWKEALMIRKQRQETLNRGLLLMTMDDMYESACRKYNRMLAAVGL